MTDPVSEAAPGLTHVRADGSAHMVDVSAKPITAREASAAGRVELSPAAVAALRSGARASSLAASAAASCWTSSRASSS